MTNKSTEGFSFNLNNAHNNEYINQENNQDQAAYLEQQSIFTPPGPANKHKGYL